MEIDNIKNWASSLTLPSRDQLHLARKVWHCVGVSSMMLFYIFAPLHWSQLAILSLMLLAVPLDYLRLKFPSFNRWAVKTFRWIMRDQEVHRMAGTSALIIGVSLLVWIFPRDVVILSLGYLVFADPLASLVGIRYGKRKIFRNKSVQGSLAAAIVCFVFTFLYLGTKDFSLVRWIVFSFLGGWIGSLSEAIPLG